MTAPCRPGRCVPLANMTRASYARQTVGDAGGLHRWRVSIDRKPCGHGTQTGEGRHLDRDEPLRDKQTLVVRLRDRISDLIRETDLKPGDKLPTEAELTRRFGISRPVVREALKLLEQDNLIYAAHGRGRFVSPMSAIQVERPITVFESVSDMTRHYGYDTINKVLSVAEEAPSDAVATQLQMSVGEQVIRIERLRVHCDIPILYCVDYVPRSVIPAALDDIDWSGSLLALLEECKNRPRMSAATVSAVTLPTDVIQRNDLGDFGPALLITETCFNAVGKPVIYAIDYHRGSHFSFSLARK
jgi:GntR family transcriptional regulator